MKKLLLNDLSVYTHVNIMHKFCLQNYKVVKSCFSAVAYSDGTKMAANSGLRTYRNPDGCQATITIAHGLSNVCLNP